MFYFLIIYDMKLVKHTEWLFFRGKTTNDRAQVDANYQMWGASQDILRKIEIPIVSGKNCRNEYGIFRKDTLLCAGAEEGKLYIDFLEFSWVKS